MQITIPKLSLVVLIGPSGSGKSTFARKHFLPTEVLSSDHCRALVCDDENDQSVTREAFEIMHFIIGKRLAAGRLTVIDATNPIADEPPANGVLRFFTGPNDSLMERLQVRAPAARFVKAFSCVGNALMVNPKLPGGPPTMFICGNDEKAKAQAGEILRQLGWEVEDCGGAEGARAIEPLCILWCIPGFLHNQWTHAFKLLV